MSENIFKGILEEEEKADRLIHVFSQLQFEVKEIETD